MVSGVEIDYDFVLKACEDQRIDAECSFAWIIIQHA